MKRTDKRNQHVALSPCATWIWIILMEVLSPLCPPPPPIIWSLQASHEFPSNKLTKHLLWDLNLSSGQRSSNKLREESLGRYKYLLFSTTSRSLPLFSSDAWEEKKSSFSETTWARWVDDVTMQCHGVFDTKSTPFILLKLFWHGCGFALHFATTNFCKLK